MKKTKILKKNYEFRKVLSKGKYYSGEYIEALILQNHKNINSLGIAINSKVGTAVMRNRLKRLFREAYNSFESNLEEGQDIVLLWKKSQDTTQATFDNIKTDLASIFDRAKILSKEK